MNFSLFSFTFYIQFILFAGKEALEIKSTFDPLTLAYSNLILNERFVNSCLANSPSAYIYIVMRTL